MLCDRGWDGNASIKLYPNNELDPFVPQESGPLLKESDWNPKKTVKMEKNISDASIVHHNAFRVFHCFKEKNWGFFREKIYILKNSSLQKKCKFCYLANMLIINIHTFFGLEFSQHLRTDKAYILICFVWWYSNIHFLKILKKPPSKLSVP